MFTEKEDDYDVLGQKVTQQTEEIRTIMENMKILKDEIETSKTYQKKMIIGQDIAPDMDDY